MRATVVGPHRQRTHYVVILREQDSRAPVTATIDLADGAVRHEEGGRFDPAPGAP